MGGLKREKRPDERKTSAAPVKYGGSDNAEIGRLRDSAKSLIEELEESINNGPSPCTCCCLVGDNDRCPKHGR